MRNHQGAVAVAENPEDIVVEFFPGYGMGALNSEFPGYFLGCRFPGFFFVY